MNRYVNTTETLRLRYHYGAFAAIIEPFVDCQRVTRWRYGVHGKTWLKCVIRKVRRRAMIRAKALPPCH